METSEKVGALATALRETGAFLKLVEPQNIHMTLKFLGNVAEEHVPRIKEMMVEAVKNIEPLNIQLVGAGAFPNLNRMRVIWIGTRGADRLVDVASYLEEELESLNFRREKRGFSPHITIARVKSPKNIGSLKRLLSEHKDEFFGEQLVESIRLKKSDLRPQGPIYSVVEEATFGER